MKTIRLLRLELENFKGVRRFSLDAQGQDATIYGDNGTGKTTIADAVMWLLFDKDSANRKDFGIKTLGLDGRPLHGVEHSVDATFQLPDGGQIKLRKVFKEVWTKKRGSAQKTFTGHTTDYYIDGVPVTKAEYTARVASLVDEKVFRLLTDPLHFNTALSWQDRRRMLLEVCGDISDEEVIASDPQLAKLPEILGDRSIDDHRKVVMARRKEVNQELERIPVRIDEASRSVPKLPEGKSKATVVVQIEELKARRTALEQEKVRVLSGGEVAEKRKTLAEIDAQMLDIANDYRQRSQEEALRKQSELNGLRRQVDELRRTADWLEDEIEATNSKVVGLTVTMNNLRNEWHQVNDQIFEHHAEDTCPTCGQAIPPEQIEEARAKALAEFNERKSRRLEQINAEGLKLKTERERLEQENDDRKQRLSGLYQQIADLERKSAALLAEIEALDTASSPEDDPDYQAIAKRKAEVEREIAQLQTNSDTRLREIDSEIQAVDNDLYFLEIELRAFEQAENADKRINELTAQEKKLAQEFERIEAELHLLDKFTQAKVRLLDEKINARFQLARFKLFEEQVNGGIAEVCETTFNGVPYSDLNHGARINVGLDIINTLAEHYGCAPMVVIDNAESITRLLPTHGQQIRLVVSASDPELRVEVAAERQEALV